MKTKLLFLLLASCLVTLAAWLVRAPKPAQANEVPEKYRDTVHKGLEYLVKHQCKDGHWEGDDGKHPVAMTALAGMALLMEGSNLHEGKYSANIRKAVDWLMDKSQAGREGLIFSEHPSETDCYMHGHGLATQFLAWASRRDFDDVRRKKLADVLTRATRYIIKAQSSQGGWYHTSTVEGHDFATISATAIQIHALYMVGTTGLPIRSEEVTAQAQEYLKTELAKHQKGAKRGPNTSKPAELAAALACRCSPDGLDYQDASRAKWIKDCLAEIQVGRDIKFGRDELTHYYYAQAVFNLMLNAADYNIPVEASLWSDYRKAMFDHLQRSQNKDGSWPASTESLEGFSVGPVYSAAVWCTVLQLDNNCHPLTRQRNLRVF